MRMTYLFCLMATVAILQTACAPISVNKCYEEYKYDESGRVKSIYKECIQQVPEKTSAIHLKNRDLYD